MSVVENQSSINVLISYSRLFSNREHKLLLASYTLYYMIPIPPPNISYSKYSAAATLAGLAVGPLLCVCCVCVCVCDFQSQK